MAAVENVESLLAVARDGIKLAIAAAGVALTCRRKLYYLRTLRILSDLCGFFVF
ncbi:MAG: hypothetical protein ACRD8U_08560 [Pyrinomonadaceae bacterium]